MRQRTLGYHGSITDSNWNSMRRLALAFLLLCVSSTGLADSLDGFSYTFRLYRNGSALGTADMQYTLKADGFSQFITRSNGTDGVASLAGAGVTETSQLIRRNGELELVSGRIDTKLAWKRSTKSTALQKGAKIYQYSDGKERRQVPYAPGLLDQHSLTLALLEDLRAGKGPQFVYTVIHKGRVETYTFKRVGEQKLDTALGKLDTVRIERIRESSDGRSTRIYFAKSLDFAPVLIQELHSKGDNIEMRALSVR